MKKAFVWFLLFVAACAPTTQETEQAAEPEMPAAPEAVDSYPDPEAQVALEVQDFLTDWVAAGTAQ